MGKAKTGDTVRIHFTGKLKDGTVFDTSEKKEPLEFTLGEGKIIPELEKNIIGMEQGGAKTVSITAEKAYGALRADLIVEIQLSQLPKDLSPEPGQYLQVGSEGGAQDGMMVKVVEVNDEAVKVDANHPLAGEDLTFEVELVSVTSNA